MVPVWRSQRGGVVTFLNSALRRSCIHTFRLAGQSTWVYIQAQEAEGRKTGRLKIAFKNATKLGLGGK